MALRMVSVVVALAVSLVLMGGPYAGTARACSCAGSADVQASLQSSDAVFSAEMIRGGVEDPAPDDGTTMGGIEFRVIESWKGVSGESVVLYGQDPAYYGDVEDGEMVVVSSCAYSFEEGESYLVYATRHGHGLQADVCSRTTALASAGKDLDALGPPADHLAETGGPPLPLVGVLAAAAVLSVFAGVLLRWARP